MTLAVSGGTSNGDAKIILTNSNGRGSDYKIQGKKDEHRFGVEVQENKQFHHTITGLNHFILF